MQLEIMTKLHTLFEDAAKTEADLTYWLARDIQPLLEYTQWRNFIDVIEKAKAACVTSGQLIKNHFADVSKMVDIGSGTTRKINDIMLTRFACYLIAQNGDPRKEAIAFAQSYFAIQTRKQELLEERLILAERIQARAKLSETEKQLSSTLYQHGVDDRGFAEIRSRGDNALFGGNNTVQMKLRLSVKKGRPLADFLPTVTLKAKEFASAITEFNVRKSDLQGKREIGDEHVRNNLDVRSVLAKSNIRPENLPAELDIQKIERKIKSQEKKQLGQEGNLIKIKQEQE